MKMRKYRKPTLKQTGQFIVVLIIVAAMVVLLIGSLQRVALWEFIAYAALVAVIFALGFLSQRFTIVDRTIQKLFFAYFLYLGWMFITLIPVVLFLRLSLFVLEMAAFGFQLTVFVVWGLLLSFALLQIATERNRERLFNRLKRLGPFAPVSYSLNLLMISVLLFSSVTYVLSVRRVLELNGSPEAKVSPDQVTLLYLWHFLEAVPLLKVNETLRWKEPLTYDSGWVGLALLIFKVAVIIPVIAAFAWYWKQVGALRTSLAPSPPE